MHQTQRHWYLVRMSVPVAGRNVTSKDRRFWADASLDSLTRLTSSNCQVGSVHSRVYRLLLDIAAISLRDSTHPICVSQSGSQDDSSGWSRTVNPVEERDWNLSTVDFLSKLYTFPSIAYLASIIKLTQYTSLSD
jgi:hypothetical protein